MCTVLIMESNTPDLVAAGNAGAAGFEGTLARLAPGVRLRMAAPYAAPLNAELLEGVDAVVFTGACVAWSTDAPEAAPLRRAMEQVFDAGLPTWGSCNGMQLACVVLGGSVAASPNGLEVGLARNVMPTPEGMAHPMLAGRTAPFAVPCIHRDEVDRLPVGAKRLAGNAHSPVQAMAYTVGGVDFWGTQYHPELGAADIAHAQRTRGLFRGLESALDDLSRADREEVAARRLGTTTAELAPEVRARDLVNWLEHVARRTAGAPEAIQGAA